MKTAARNFALFFTTQGRSLEMWDRLGMFEREAALYRLIAPTFDTVYFFTYGSTKDMTYGTRLPSNVVVVPKPSFLPVFLYSFLLPFIHLKKLRSVQILKTNQMDGSWSAVIAKKLYGSKLIVRCGYEWLQFIEGSKRPWFKREFVYWAEKFAYKHADKIVVTSTGTKDFITERFSVLPERITIIPNYVPTELFYPKDIPIEAGRIIAVGRLESQKNISLLISALSGLSMKLVLVGAGSLQEKLQEEAKSHGVNVEFRGILPQSQIASELCQSEMYILPSLYEGHPKTLLEAMSCGVPCIGTNIAGIKDTIINGQNGIICETTVESIRRAIVTLHGDPLLQSRLGTAAWQTVQEKYSLEKVFAQEQEVYRVI